MKSKLLLSFLLLAILFVIYTIKINKTVTNGIEDRIDGEQVSSDFFKYRNSNNLDALIQLFDDEFIEKTGRKEFIKQLSGYSSRLGALKKDSLATWKTIINSGSDSSSSYLFVYYNKYENANSIETFKMKKGFWGGVEIVDYKQQIK